MAPKHEIADKLIDWMELNLKITSGPFLGEDFEVMDWQRKFIRGIFKQGISTAVCSTSRGNGKTELQAALGLAMVIESSPLCEKNMQSVIVASSFSQARLTFDALLLFAEPFFEKYGRDRFRIFDSSNHAMIMDIETKCKLRAIASDSKRAHGLNLKYVLADEAAQWPEKSSSKMFVALQTQQGKNSDSKLICVSTKPAFNSESWFSKLLENATPGCYRQLHQLKKDSTDYFNPRVWVQANPSLKNPKFKNLKKQIALEAKKAAMDSAELASFKSLRLNLGVSDVEIISLLDLETWRNAEDNETEKTGDVIFGIDVGSTSSWSAISAIWLGSGVLDCAAYIGGIPSLEERAILDQNDASLYIEMVARGELHVFPDCRVIRLSDMLDLAVLKFGAPLKILCDAWKWAELKDAMAISKKLEPCELIKQRTGYYTQSQDIRLFRRSLLDGSCKPRQNLLLRNGLRECRVARDSVGNERITKETRRSRAKDDSAISAVLAVSEFARIKDREAAIQAQEFELVPLNMEL